MAAGHPPKKKLEVPATRKEALLEKLHGVDVADPFRWLEEEKSPEVQAWMKAQDAYTRNALHAYAKRPQLVERLKELAYVDSASAPIQAGGRLFYVRTFANKEKGILYWREGEKGEEKVLLDPNTWEGEGGVGTVSLGLYVPSEDGKKLAFTRKPNAADEAILHILDVDTGKWSEIDVIEGAKYARPHWTPDGKALVYEWLPTDPTIPIAERPGYTEIRMHRVGTDPKSDRVLHPKLGDPTAFLFSSLSRDGKYLFIYVQRGWAENDIYWRRFTPTDLTAEAPGKREDFDLLVAGKGAKYEINAWKDQFYVLTDEGAPKQRLFKVSPSKPARKAWKEVIAEDASATLQDATIVGNHLSLAYLKNASSELRLATLEGKPVRTVKLPGIGTSSQLVGNEDEDTAYFSYTSFITPRQVYRASVKSGEASLFDAVKVPFDAEAYTVEQVFYPSKDGTKIPMFLVHKKGLVKDGSHPVLLYGYGGFNVSLTPGFRGTLHPWLEAGGVYAVANLRGGGEYGKTWHEAGRLGRKQNVFDDFIAAGEYLVNEQYTRPEKLAIWGGSNGGLLVGAAMVQRPDLYGAVVCAVPLLDMVRYHLFGSGRTWIPEYGTAEDPEQFKYLHAYSPYHHVKEGTDYPAMLMLASDHDDRVDPMHARKFTAAVQAATAGDAPAIIRIEKNAGHGGADQVRQSIELYADMFAFLMARFGMTPDPSAPSVNPAANAQ